MDQPKKFYLLELGRGIAAILVVLYHTDKYYFGTAKYWTEPLLGGFFKFGHAGVQFFFVLSGFIMIWAHYDDLGQEKKIKDFLRKRFVRIYPITWLTVGIATVLYLVAGTGAPQYREPLYVLQSLMLVGREPLSTINFPTWTLWHENLFYLVCLIIIARPRIGFSVLILWAATCVALAFAGPAQSSLFYAFRAENALFALGVLCSIVLRRFKIRSPSIFLIASTLAFFGFGIWTNWRTGELVGDNIVYGAASAIIIVGAVEAPMISRARFQAISSFFGTLSFPIYLTHMITLPFVAKSLRLMNGPALLHPVPAALIMLAASVAVAVACHRFFEKPVTAWLRSKLKPRESDRTEIAPI